MKELIENYRAVFLLPICRKLLENLCSSNFSVLLTLEICFQLINQGSVSVTPVYVNSSRLFMKSTIFLTSITVKFPPNFVVWKLGEIKTFFAVNPS